jgi:UDP:flavonoid glycosyltransferase YjiC (YdhE family)
VPLDRPLTVLFMPESAYGPTNNCIGIGDVLRRRGHRVVFAAEASWKGKLTGLGFEEDLVDLSPPADVGEPGAPEQDAGQFWKDFIRDTAPEFRKPTIEQLDTWVRPVWDELITGARYSEPQLREIVARTRPDVVVEDNVVAFPALVTAGVPFVRIVSCNPLELKGSGVAPVFSGYPADDRRGWGAFRAEYERTHRPMWEQFSAWVAEQGAPRCRTWSSSTRATSTSTCTRRSSTTSPTGRSARSGTGSSRRCGAPRTRPSCRRRS